MIRVLSLAAALAAGTSFSAFAAETNSGAALHSLFTEVQARQHLLHLGYTDVSPMSKDADGKWIGTATKDGKVRGVAVDIRGPVPTSKTITN
ncbi:hypothetical protein [Hyphomicrobium sp. LHD-15]|uniref:hypothetical protein n=1 Tax=Hyphomicrobium sp. LHD-15 TaxID=3072142 RepID=UPI00280F6965|nr:hypothetical protein [Hyphomicrobium sp. LHD-15]MDQ8700136.1 hypothetical protein [Hyphomicrobium sp. LHD-15]